MMKHLLVLLTFWFSVTASAQDSTIVKVETPKILTQLQHGKTFTHQDVTVKFIKVIRDSRCPKNVMCIWAGEAEVLIGVYKKGKKSEEKIIKITPNTQLATLFSSESLTISAYNLLPYPDGVENGEDKNYRLQITFKD